MLASTKSCITTIRGRKTISFTDACKILGLTTDETYKKLRFFHSLFLEEEVGRLYFNVKLPKEPLNLYLQSQGVLALIIVCGTKYPCELYEVAKYMETRPSRDSFIISLEGDFVLARALITEHKGAKAIEFHWLVRILNMSEENQFYYHEVFRVEEVEEGEFSLYCSRTEEGDLILYDRGVKYLISSYEGTTVPRQAMIIKNLIIQ